MTTPTPVPTCSECNRPRDDNDDLGYNPLQVVFGQKVGWYSGDDCEMCGPCMTKLLASSNRGGR